MTDEEIQEPAAEAAVEAPMAETCVAVAVEDSPVAAPEPAPAPAVDPAALCAAIEAMLLATGEPLSLGTLADLLGVKKNVVEAALALLKERYAAGERGIALVEIAGGFQFGTKPEHAGLIERMLKEVRKVRLSPAALETLAIIAYRQPVTRNEIEAIRGVNIDGVMKTLLDRELIKITGKKEEPGRPLLYGTTEGFLMHFGLNQLSDLPPLSEYDEIAKAKAMGEMQEENVPDWMAISEQQRESLSELASAAERELADLDDKLKALKPPKVVVVEDAKPE